MSSTAPGPENGPAVLPALPCIGASSPPASSADARDDGDPHRWFREQVQPHESHLKSYLRGSFPTLRSEIDDLVQETFLRIWKVRAARSIQSARAFLYKVAKHAALDSLRHHRRSPIDAVSDLEGLDVLEDRPVAADAVGLQEKIEALTDIIAALPAGRREILLLRKFRRLSQRETAEALGVSERTVENQLYRAVRQCEEKLRARGIRNLYGDEKR